MRHSSGDVAIIMYLIFVVYIVFRGLGSPEVANRYINFQFPNCTGRLRPNKLTFMVLVGARTTFSSRTNFFFFKKIKKKKN